MCANNIFKINFSFWALKETIYKGQPGLHTEPGKMLLDTVVKKPNPFTV